MLSNFQTKVSVIIVTWNNERDIIRCVDSILKYEHDIEIIVVDNNSQDNTVNVLKNKKEKGLIILELKNNIGFAAANNEGLKYAHGEYILYLNPDTQFIESGLNELTNQLNDRVGLVGCQLLNPDKSYQPSTYMFDNPVNIVIEQFRLGKLLPKVMAKKYAPYLNRIDKNVEVDWLVGAFLLISKRDCLRIGGFSTDYFMYAEDMDIAFKVHKLQKKVLFSPDFKIVHVGGNSERQDVSSSKKEKMFLSRKVFSNKYGYNNIRIFYWCYLIKFLLFSLIGLASGKYKKRGQEYRRTLNILKKIEE
ncbi:glycosyltransferase family 2 protein [Lactiplantibacillus plantarum]|uniref:glycosyltransferase family 2 protein n=1 Tax=Lactiplantibacillus plantarum TaxID=1590 RepID=UPI002477E0A8|nr:glycosyltransferase family 2 protein [Lactiplantibacillus plantarum]